LIYIVYVHTSRKREVLFSCSTHFEAEKKLANRAYDEIRFGCLIIDKKPKRYQRGSIKEILKRLATKFGSGGINYNTGIEKGFSCTVVGKKRRMLSKEGSKDFTECLTCNSFFSDLYVNGYCKECGKTAKAKLRQLQSDTEYESFESKVHEKQNNYLNVSPFERVLEVGVVWMLMFHLGDYNWTDLPIDRQFRTRQNAYKYYVSNSSNINNILNIEDTWKESHKKK